MENPEIRSNTILQKLGSPPFLNAFPKRIGHFDEECPTFFTQTPDSHPAVPEAAAAAAVPVPRRVSGARDGSDTAVIPFFFGVCLAFKRGDFTMKNIG